MPPPSHPPIRRARLLAYALLVQLVALVALAYGLELWLRYRYQEQSVPSNERSWIYYPLGPDIAGQTLRFDQVEFSTTMRYNRMGFRGPELPGLPRPAGEKRVVYVGDSFVEGIGVAEDRRFSDLVQAELAGNRDRYTTVNLGQAGTDPINYLNNLANLGLPLRPHVVVLGLYLGNDFESAARHPVKGAWNVRAETPGSTLLCGSAASPAALGYVRLIVRQKLTKQSFLVRRSSALDFWERLYRRPINREMIRERAELSESEMTRALATVDLELAAAATNGRLNPSSLIDVISKRPRESPQQFYSDDDFAAVASILAECQRLCAEQGSTLVVLLIPDISQVMSESFLATCKRWGYADMPARVHQLPVLRQRMAALLAERKIEHIDLTGPLSALGEGAYYPLDRHLTELGHRCIARQLLDHPAFRALSGRPIDDLRPPTR